MDQLFLIKYIRSQLFLFISYIDFEMKVAEEEAKITAENQVEIIKDKIPYPKSVFFIFATEACERFSYYGMKGKGINAISIFTTNGYMGAFNLPYKFLCNFIFLLFALPKTFSLTTI